MGSCTYHDSPVTFFCLFSAYCISWACFLSLYNMIHVNCSPLKWLLCILLFPHLPYLTMTAVGYLLGFWAFADTENIYGTSIYPYLCILKLVGYVSKGQLAESEGMQMEKWRRWPGRALRGGPYHRAVSRLCFPTSDAAENCQTVFVNSPCMSCCHFSVMPLLFWFLRALCILRKRSHKYM